MRWTECAVHTVPGRVWPRNACASANLSTSFLRANYQLNSSANHEIALIIPVDGAGILACRSSKEGVSRLRSRRLRSWQAGQAVVFSGLPPLPKSETDDAPVHLRVSVCICLPCLPQAGSGRLAEEVVPSSTARGSGTFWKWEAHAEPRGTCHGAFVPLVRPAAGAAGLSGKINIVKLTHYPVRASLARCKPVCYFHSFGLRWFCS